MSDKRLRRTLCPGPVPCHLSVRIMRTPQSLITQPSNKGTWTWDRRALMRQVGTRPQRVRGCMGTCLIGVLRPRRSCPAPQTRPHPTTERPWAKPVRVWRSRLGARPREHHGLGSRLEQAQSVPPTSRLGLAPCLGKAEGGENPSRARLLGWSLLGGFHELLGIGV